MAECEIEGLLYKWTNYWGGWQPRWFVLSHGILAYYNSAEEIGQGCRASLNVSAGDIKVHTNDITRFDIILQHEQHWYLRASTVTERQKWLIAIGTVKAGSTEEQMQKQKESTVAKDELQSRISELRLYCDLLVHQVTQLKQEAQSEKTDCKKLTEASSMLSATCDTFLGTLGQCLTVAEAHFSSPSFDRSSPHERDEVKMALPYTLTHKNKERRRHGTRSMSVDESSPSPHDPHSKYHNLKKRDRPPHHSAPTTPNIVSRETDMMENAVDKLPAHSELEGMPLRTENQSLSSSSGGDLEPTPAIDADNNNKVCVNTDKSETKVKDHDFELSREERHLTFFSAMLHSFTDIVLEEDGGVPTSPFLSACDDLMPFLDTIGSTAFAPVRMDFNGNIKKLRTKQMTNPTRFCTLQGIVQQEIDTNSTKVRNSATDALLWLKRGLRFIQQFLINVRNGENDLTVALNQSYAVTLKRYHGWVVKGIFALAVKAAPYHDAFIRALATDADAADSPTFFDELMQDVEQYSTAIEVVLSIVDNFYQQNALDLDTVVG